MNIYFHFVCRYSNLNGSMEKKSSFLNKMAVSAPTTPAHGAMNLQSESLAWLEKAALNGDGKDNLLDIPSNQQYEPDNTYKVVDKSKGESTDQKPIINFNGLYG